MASFQKSMVRAAGEWGPDSVKPYQDILATASIEQAMAIDAALERFPCGEPVLFFPFDDANWCLLTERGLVWSRDGEFGFARHEEIKTAEPSRSMAPDQKGVVSLRTNAGSIPLRVNPDGGVDGLVKMLQRARTRRAELNLV